MSTIKDVAKASGVSSATVSYVLNNRPGTVSAPTRERVLRAMRDLNYRPSPLFRRKHASRTNTLGVLQAHWGYNTLIRFPYYAHILDGILTTTTAVGWNLTLFTSADWGDVPKSLRTYVDGRCDGLILVSPPKNFSLVAGLRERGFPFVVVNGGASDEAVANVDIDNVAGGKAATEHLLSLGHRRIAMLPGGDEYANSQERIEGYRRALQNAGLPRDPERIVPGDYGEASGRERADGLMTLPAEARPTALFCANDQIAAGAIAAIREAGLSIPGDISVIGFDDSAPNSLTSSLTTIRQPLERMSARAASLLIEQIQGDGANEIVREVMPFELVIRETTGAVKRV